MPTNLNLWQLALFVSPKVLYSNPIGSKVGDLEKIADDSGEEIEVSNMNGVIPFEVSINNQILNFKIGGVSYEEPIGFKPYNTWLFGFGTQGVAQYYIRVMTS